jgi:hypothetical protein
VTVASSRIDAELLVGMLLSNGVHAVVSADDAARLEPQLQIHGVRILVAPCLIESGLSQVTDVLNDQSLRRTLSTVWNPDLEWLARHV